MTLVPWTGLRRICLLTFAAFAFQQCTNAKFYGDRKKRNQDDGGSATAGPTGTANASGGNATSNASGGNASSGNASGSNANTGDDYTTGYEDYIDDDDYDDDGGNGSGNGGGKGGNGGNASSTATATANANGNASGNAGVGGGAGNGNGGGKGGAAGNAGENGNAGGNGAAEGGGVGNGNGNGGNGNGNTGENGNGAGNGGGNGAAEDGGVGNGNGGNGNGNAGGNGNGGGNGGKPPVFFKCLGSNADLFPIFVRAYDFNDLKELAKQDNARCMREVNNQNVFEGCRFLQDHFDSKIRVKARRRAEFCMESFNVSPRPFTDGFPKNDGTGDKIPLLEWFALDAYADIKVLYDGVWQFKVVSDDGVVMDVDNVMRLDNDGIHHPVSKAGTAYNLKKGLHRIRLRYFQGPKYQIALRLFWSRNGGQHQRIPRQAFRYILNIEKQQEPH